MGVLDKIDASGDCHLWLGRINSDGYGTWGSDLAHRVVFRHYNGDIPKGMVIRHNCDNPPCVNPAHLLLGTQKENVRDCISRGRRSENRGLNKHHRKLSVEDVPDITSLYGEGNSYSSIARKYGVSYPTIRKVIDGTHWTTKDF